MKIKENHRRDFKAYYLWYKVTKKSNFCPFGTPVLTRGDNSAIKSWLMYESQGKLLPCKHLRLLKAILIGKQSLNFHIKQWAEGLKDIPLFELMEDYPFLPEWVWDAVRAQFYKNYDPVRETAKYREEIKFYSSMGAL